MQPLSTSLRRVWLASSFALALAALGGCASSGPSERASLRLDQFEAAAGAPVDSFHFFDIQRWEQLGDEALAVWTRPNQAFLLDVRPCRELEWTMGIGLTSTMNRVYARLDSVLAGDLRCQITQIRPIDVAALKKLRQAEPAA